MEILFWDFLLFYQIFLSPKVKQSMIISNKQGVYELPHELPNDLRLRILGNKEKLGKSQNLLEWKTSAQSLFSAKMNFFSILAKNY